MFSGSTLAGSKTTGDGALHKSGSSIFHLRPASGLTGSIWLDQGEIRQYTDNSSTIPAGGIFRMSAGTIYRSDGTSRTNAKATQIDGSVTLGHSGGGELTLSGSMNLTAGQRSLTTDCDIVVSGVISNGGLTKVGSGKLTLSGANTYALGTLVSAGTLEGRKEVIEELVAGSDLPVVALADGTLPPV
jgi:autotransporter-associated beta strand protein